MHVLPKGLHRIRHYGLLANANRAANIAKARELLAAPGWWNNPEGWTPCRKIRRCTTKAAHPNKHAPLPHSCRSQLRGSRPGTSFRNQMAYRQAGLFVTYLRDTNPVGFWRMMSSILDGRPFAEAVTRGYETDLHSSGCALCRRRQRLDARFGSTSD
jgi:hypothetical protein